MITSIVPFRNYTQFLISNKYEIINSDKYPNRMLKKNFLFYSTSEMDFNVIGNKKLGISIESIFGLDENNPYEIYDKEIILDYDKNIEICHDFLEKIDDSNLEENIKFKLRSSYEIIEEFILYCKENNLSSVIFINSFILDGLKK